MNVPNIRSSRQESTAGHSLDPREPLDKQEHRKKQIENQRLRLTAYLSDCLEKGIQCEEFRPVPVEATTGFLLSAINGLLRRKGLLLDRVDGLQDATVAFCRHSLLNAP